MLLLREFTTVNLWMDTAYVLQQIYVYGKILKK